MSMENKRILVTAAGQGMGRGSAIALAEAGAEVIATDMDAALLEQLPNVDGRLTTRVLDVTDANAITSLAAELPGLDGLFNCAGIVHHGTILDLDDTAWELSLSVNLTSMVRMTRAFLPGMLERAKKTGSVSILNMSSMASSIKGFPNRTAYGATKAGVVGLTKAVAADFVAQGVRCNAVAPGWIDTELNVDFIESLGDPVAFREQIGRIHPLRRTGAPEEVAELVVWLASDKAAFVTGQVWTVDGGRMCQLSLP